MGTCESVEASTSFEASVNLKSEDELKSILSKLGDANIQKLSAAINATAPIPTVKAEKKATGTSVAIIYYSTYGHILKLAEVLKKSLEDAGISVDIFQVPETLPADVLAKMNAPPKPEHIPVLDREMMQKLPEYDGFLFGMPSRFSMMAAQMKAFWDSTGQLWQSQTLAGKPAGTFVSSGNQGGGQELVHLTCITHFASHGMMYVPLGYQAGDIGQFDLKELHGGSPYGVSTFASGPQPTEMELGIAKRQAEKFAEVVKRSVKKPASTCKILIVYYSTYGHIKKMADKIAEGAKKEAVTVDLYQVEETLGKEALKGLGAPPKPSDPVMNFSNISKLAEYDGIMIGTPTRFGKPAAQIKSFWDATGGLWAKGALAGKLGATFVSVGTGNGGQETTHFTALTEFVHHGMVYVPLGSAQKAIGEFDSSEFYGASPWGSGTYAGGDGSRQPSDTELKIAEKHGQIFAAKVKAMAA